MSLARLRLSRPHLSAHDLPERRILLCLAGLAVLICAGCASPRVAPIARASASPTSPTPTARRTVPPLDTCASMTPGPGSLASVFPLPAGTISSGPNGAAGAGYFIECTPSTSQQAILAFLNTAVPQAGWRPWDPQRDIARCGGQSNDFWKWSNGTSAVGYRFDIFALPEWQLVFCDLAFGR